MKIVLQQLALGAFALLTVLPQIGISQTDRCTRFVPYAYDAVSIKPLSGSDLRGSWTSLGGEGFSSIGFPVVGMISAAYEIPSNRIISLPSWVKDSRYAVIAKMTDDQDTQVSPADRTLGTLYQLRLKSLLCERFALRVHSEKRLLRAFRLVLSSNGLKLSDSTGEGSSSTRRANGIELTGATMQMIATTLSNLLESPVIDGTSNSGRYDFKLDWDEDSARDRDAIKADVLANIEGVAGLKLVEAKQPLDVLVVESISAPTPN